MELESTKPAKIPSPILLTIFSKLPPKTLSSCLNVCKEWRALISSRDFAQLYLPVSLLLIPYPHPRNNGQKAFPLIDAESLLTCSSPTSPIDVQLTLMGNTHFPNFIRCGSSCNGLLCLEDFKTMSPIYICNPILGQYITLPDAQRYASGCAFGFSPRTKEYKAVRTFYRPKYTATGVLDYENEVYTLGGSGLWRSLGYSSNYTVWNFAFNAFLNGAHHWLPKRYDSPFICRFDFDLEQFDEFPQPPGLTRRSAKYIHLGNYMRLGVLRGCLCIYDLSPGRLEIWSMKEYGVKNSWCKEVFITDLFNGCICQGYFEPIMMENGKLLVILRGRELTVFDPENDCLELVKINATESKFRGISYVPSYTSLFDVAKGENISVLNL